MKAREPSLTVPLPWSTSKLAFGYCYIPSRHSPRSSQASLLLHHIAHRSSRMPAGAKAAKQAPAKLIPSAAKQRPRYNVPVAFMSRGVVDPYEVERAVIEPPRSSLLSDQAAEPSGVEVPSSRSGLGAESSSTAMHTEEGTPPAGADTELTQLYLGQA